VVSEAEQAALLSVFACICRTPEEIRRKAAYLIEATVSDQPTAEECRALLASLMQIADVNG